MIVVNLKPYPAIINGIRFLPGIFQYEEEVVNKAKESPLGDGAQIGKNRMPVFNSFSEVESSFHVDELKRLIEISLEQARIEGGSAVYAEEKLREFWKGFSKEEIKKFLLSLKEKLEKGERSSKFAPYEGMEKYEITL